MNIPSSSPFSSDNQGNDDQQQYWGAGGIASVELLNNLSKANTTFRQQRQIPIIHPILNQRKKSRNKINPTTIQKSQSMPVLSKLPQNDVFNLTQISTTAISPTTAPGLEVTPLTQISTTAISPTTTPGLEATPTTPPSIPGLEVTPLHQDTPDIDTDSDDWEDQDLDLMTPRSQQNFDGTLSTISKSDFSLVIQSKMKLLREKKLSSKLLRKVRREDIGSSSKFAKRANQNNLNRWIRSLSEKAAENLGIVRIERDPGAPKLISTKSIDDIALEAIAGQPNYIPEPLLQRGSLSNLSIGSTRLEPILPCLQSELFLDLSSNRISLGRSTILQDIGKFVDLKHLSLSSNLVSNGSAKGLVEILALPKLESLILQDCKIGAMALKSLAMALKKSTTRHSSSLKFLDIRGNNIDDKAAIWLSQCLSHTSGAEAAAANVAEGEENNHEKGMRISSLQNLAIDNNAIRTNGLDSLVHALTEGEGGKRLQRLTISMNPIGKNGALSIASLLQNCKQLTDLNLSWTKMSTLCDEFRDALGNNKQLLHLSLSHNSLNTDECTLLRDSLTNNHTLLGLHIQTGNCCSIDWSGIIHPAPATNGLRLRTLATLSYEGHTVSDGSGFGSQNCWLCENWSEVEFIWTPGKSGSGVRNSVCVCLASESWKQHPMKHDSVTNTWKLCLCLPPTIHRYMFGVDDGFEFASDYPTMLSQLWPGSNGKCMVNVCKVNARPFGTKLNCQNAKPRLELKDEEELAFENEEANTPWSFTTSVFLPRQKHAYLKDIKKQTCQYDLSLIKGPSHTSGHTSGTSKEEEDQGLSTMFDDTDQMAISSLMENKYDMLMDNFRTYTTIGKAVSPITHINKSQWRIFLKDCKLLKTKKYKDGFITTADADIIFTSSKRGGDGKDALQRSDFCEAICQVIKHLKIERKDELVRLSAEDVLQRISTHGQRLESDLFRKSNLYIKDVDILLRAHLLELKSMHQRLGIETKKGNSGLTLEKWINLCNASFDGITKSKTNSLTTRKKMEEDKSKDSSSSSSVTRPYTVKDLCEIFAISCMNVIDDENADVLLFADFLEAICRYAKLMVKPSLDGTLYSIMSRSDQRIENSSWQRIKELATHRQIFLEKEGRFVTIFSKSLRDRANEMKNQEEVSGKVITDDKTEGVKDTATNDADADADAASTDAAVDLTSDENENEETAVDSDMENYFNSIKNTIEQLCEQGKRGF